MTRSIFTAQYDRLCAILIKARVDAGMSQEALAMRLGRPQSFVSKFETKQRRLDVIEFLQVADCLHANGPELLARLTDGSDEQSGPAAMLRESSHARKPAANGVKAADGGKPPPSPSPRTPVASRPAKKNGNGKNGR